MAQYNDSFQSLVYYCMFINCFTESLVLRNEERLGIIQNIEKCIQL